ncbi:MULTISPECIES: ATP-binding protein [unclassified Caballeronia]|uniref:ATP-binding protein n=1 Tax=unclassified Caballeronia TaxID=2646786 RepID=UPI002862C31B|nr:MULTISPECIES: ATP-binding protein [unclassified Caballeronia]MDR5753138.1 ATP-binding protein [Caballeronia sp. LZ024]MDR5842021.1 ATP-binding protein [Caballeronia sp. LZ031]
MVTRLLRSLFARNIALLVALVALSQVCSLTVLMHYVQTPRIERAAATFANYIDTLGGIVAAAPPDARAAFVERLHARRDLPAEAALEPPRSLTTLYRSYQRSTFLAMLRRHLPADVPVRWQIADGRSGGDERLWLRLRVGGEPYWIALAIPEAAHGEGFASTILLSLALAALATLTAYVIQRHLNHPLDNLARAARHLSAGGQPEPLPVDGPTEIAQVSLAFNQMTDALREAEATRALMLAGISHDIRTPLTKLRLAMAMAIPAGGDQTFVASSENYLDQIDGILQQFMDYAGSGAKEMPVDGDLNALVASLAGDFAGLGHEFELTLGDLPPFPFRPVSTMRLLMNLMQNAVLYGVTGLSVRTWLDADAQFACIAIGDRGKGIAVDEMEKLKEPFRRGRGGAVHPSGTGLGLAIVERIAKLHGGTLMLRAREGGGMEAVVTMRLG